jgi:hypothetical protein
MKVTEQYDVCLYEDSKWKETFLSKLEIVLDDARNPVSGLGDIGDSMEYGKNYRITFSIEEINQ